MKINFKLLAFGILTIIAITSCQKEDINPTKQAAGSTGLRAKKTAVTRPYKDSFNTWYSFVPDIAGGWTESYGPLLAWYPGGGEGTATHLGKSHTFFNQYVPFNPPDISSVAAPVTQFFSAQLAAAGINGVPSNVSTITYDDFGNSVWFHQTTSITTPASNTRLNFVATAEIVGGTGKFENATGSTTITGYLNPTDRTDAAFASNGSISY